MKVYVDSNGVIYLLEGNPYWQPVIDSRIAKLRTAGDEFVVSDLTRAECLVGPFKSANTALVAIYDAFFNDPGVIVLPLTREVCVRSARVRASTSFKLGDSLHLAAAIEHGCDLFLTNDIRLTRCRDIAVEVLT